MPIEFECGECGRQIRVREELAGKRVKCPGCAEAVTVPEEDAEPAPKRPSAVRASKPVAPPPPPARKRRDDDEEDEAPRRKSRRDEDDDDDPDSRPSSRKSRVRDDDDDEDAPPRRRSRDDDDDFDDDPKAKKKKNLKKTGSRLPLILGISGGVVGLLLVGLLLWWLLGGGGGAGNLKQFVPGDGTGFASIRVADLWKDDAVQKAVAEVKKKNPDAGDLASQMDEMFGLKPSDIERLTIVLGDPDKEEMWYVVETVAAYDEAKLKGKLQDVKEFTAEGKKYIKGSHATQPEFCAHFAGNRMIVIGPEKGIKKALATSANRKSGAMDDGLALLSGSKHFVGAFALPPKAKKELQGMTKNPMFAQFAALSEITSGTATISLGKTLDSDLAIAFPDATKAKAAKDAADNGIKTLKGLVALAKMQPGEAGKQAAEAEKALDGAKIDLSGNKVVMRGSQDTSQLLAQIMPELGKIRLGGGGNMVLSNNFKQIGLSLHNFHSVYNGMPTNICDPRTGKALLSWRVAILPYIEQDVLYKQFRLNEAWDSPHNKKLISQMPRIYARPGAPNNGRTYVLSFSRGGKHILAGAAPSAQAVGMSFTQVTDGTSNTIFLVDSSRAVDWTKPEDIELGPQGSPKASMRFVGPGCLIGLLDGSVRHVKAAVSDNTLKAAVTPNGGDVLGPDWN